jgi:phage-related protein
MGNERRDLIPIASALADLRDFPADVKDVMGQALLDAQYGDRHPAAKPLHGFGGAGVLEIVDDYDGDTYRAVYTVQLRSGVYLLHAFQKKARRGIKTDRHDSELIKRRLNAAIAEDARRIRKGYEHE